MYKKNKFIDRIVANIQFERNLIYMLRIQEHEIKWLDFQNSHQKIYEKFEKYFVLCNLPKLGGIEGREWFLNNKTHIYNII